MKPVLLLSLAFASLSFAESPQGYYRRPALHGDILVFVSEGDLWRVEATGGVARRLTTHPGAETSPAISPDGKMIAFIGQYEGLSEVYTMPLEGGLPVRQTFEGGAPKVVGWTPDGKVLFNTDKYSALPNVQLVTLDPATHVQHVLPLAQASDGTYDPATGTLFFVRLPKQNSSTKRYHGGWVENLWRYKEGDAEAVPLNGDDTGTNREPMWWQGRVYFTSDRDGVMNLWSMTPDGGDLKQHTHYKDMDVKGPSLDAGRIAYQHGADLFLHDIGTGRDTLMKISLASDFDQEREHWIKKPMEYLTSAHLSPAGDKLVLTSRGEVFVAPVETGRLVQLPRKADVRYRNAAFLPDNKSLVVQSDESGENEFWKLQANGLGGRQRLSNDGKTFRLAQVSSPDGRWLAWSDKNLKLWVMNIETKQTRLVRASPTDEIEEFSWSPDSQWLAYVEEGSNSYAQIKLYRLSDGSTTTATSDRCNSHSPAWSQDGKFLYFLSERDLHSLVAGPWGPRQPEPYFGESTKIYQLALQKGLRSPFKQKDELTPETPLAKLPVAGRDELVERITRAVLAKLPQPEKKPEEQPKPIAPPPPVKPPPGSADTPAPTPGPAPAKPEAAGDPVASATAAAPLEPAKPKPAAIDLDGLMARLEELPVKAGNYKNLRAGPKYLYFTSKPSGYEARNALKHLEISPKGKPNTLVDDMTSFELSADGRKLLVRKGESFHVLPSDTVAPAKMEEPVKLDGWIFAVSPREEWRQIFIESWRMMRDYFYDPAMHGIDWPAMRDRYLPLVDRVSDRAELNDIIGEMVGELSTLHLFVRYGDMRPVPDKIDDATLGAQFSRDEAGGGWKVGHIYRTDPDFPAKLTPLLQPEVNVKEGDVITRVNGLPTLAAVSLNQLLRNQAGKQILIEVKSGTSAHQAIVRPFSAEQDEDARYSDWEYSRRLKVEEQCRGQIGYVHLRAMGQENIAEWAQGFYPVYQRQGLIIDVRNNRGGNIDSWIIEKLLRKAWSYMQPRVGDPNWNMQYAFRGHVVVLCNHRTGSDGEGFSEGFHRLGIGKVLGTRTWGGNVWLSAERWLIDSGMATAAETGNYGPEGKWIIEGHGVDPDIVVDNLPHATFNGADAQLDAAIKHLQDLIAKDPRPVPPKPKYPVKR
ncbi:MAG: protease [Verrucomicrobiaceae bacterium]|nr:protease [Verrucomicrobiaceae bacterium]